MVRVLLSYFVAEKVAVRFVLVVGEIQNHTRKKGRPTKQDHGHDSRGGYSLDGVSEAYVNSGHARLQSSIRQNPADDV